MKADNSYSRIISNFRDPKTGELVNSFNYKSISPNRLRKWSPGISTNESFRKKRDREDRYVEGLKVNERPVLLVKNKEVYKNLKNPHFLDFPEDKEHFFKISKNTDLVNNVDEEINSHQAFLNRTTMVYEPGQEAQKETGLKNIYRIDGIEFLPEGFLELDPVLMKDEYEFETRCHEQLFAEDRRKAVAKRRKQYAQRKFKKMRDVTFFVVDEQKDRLLDYLEKWYYQNKRKMTEKEIEELSKQINIPAEDLMKLQDKYLQKKLERNSLSLKNYLAMRTSRNSDIPESLRKYFRKYHPSVELGQMDLSNQDVTKKSLPRPKSQILIPRESNLNSKINYITDESTDNQNEQPPKSSNALYEYDYTEKQTNLAKTKSTVALKQKPHLSVRFAEEERKTQKEPISLYGDEEVDQIIANLKEQNKNLNEKLTKVIFCDQCQKIYGLKFDQLACKHIIEQKIEPKKSIYQEKKSVIDRASMKTQTFNSDRNSKQSFSFRPSALKNESFTKQNDLERKSEQIKMNKNSVIKNVSFDEGSFRNSEKISNQPSFSKTQSTVKDYKITEARNTKNNQKLHSLLEEYKDYLPVQQVITESTEFNHNPDTDTFGNKKGTEVRIDPTILESRIDEHISIPKKTGTNVFNEECQKKITVVSANEKGETLVSYKLNPIILDNEYFFQSVEELHHEDGRYTVSVITKNEDGDVFSVQNIKERFRGSSYSNSIYQSKSISFSGKERVSLLDPIRFEGNNEQKVTIVVKNEKDEIVAIQKSKPTTVVIDCQTEDEKQIIKNTDGKKLSTIASKQTEKGIIKQHQLSYSLVGQEYYHQIIEEFIGENVRTATLITKSESGAVLSSISISPPQKGLSFCTEIIENKDKSVNFVTLSTEGETIMTQTFKMATIQNNDEQELPDVELERFSTLVKVLNDQKEVIAVQVLKQTNPNNSKLFQIEETFGGISEKKGTIATFKEKQQKVRIHKCNAIFVGCVFYFQIVEEKITKEGREFSICTLSENGETISVRNGSKIAGTNFFSVVVEDKLEDNRRTVVVETRSDLDEVLIRQQFVAPQMLMIEEQHFAQVLDEQIDDLGLKKVTMIKKDSGKDVFTREFKSTISEQKIKQSENKNNSIIQQKDSIIEKKVSTLPKSSFLESKNSIPESKNNLRESLESQTEDIFVDLKLKFSKAFKNPPQVDINEKEINIRGKVSEQKFQNQQSLKIQEHDQNKSSLIKSESTRKSDFPSNFKKKSTQVITVQDQKIQNEEQIVEKRSTQQQLIEQPKQNSIIESHKISQIKKNEIKRGSINSDEINKIKIIGQDVDPNLLQKSEDMKVYLENYIQILKESRENGQIDQNAILQSKVEQTFIEQIDKLDNQSLNRLSQGQKMGDILNEFQQFCKDELPQDSKYKESILLVSLFYYFVEKKNKRLQLQLSYFNFIFFQLNQIKIQFIIILLDINYFL